MPNPSHQKYYNDVTKHTEDLDFGAMIDVIKEEVALAVIENYVIGNGISTIDYYIDSW